MRLATHAAMAIQQIRNSALNLKDHALAKTASFHKPHPHKVNFPLLIAALI